MSGVASRLDRSHAPGAVRRTGGIWRSPSICLRRANRSIRWCDSAWVVESSDFKMACAVLGLVGSAAGRPTPAEVKSAYRLRAAILHPDVHQQGGGERSAAATAAMQQLNGAYQLALAHLRTTDESDPRAGSADLTVRCRRCSMVSPATREDNLLICPRCGQRLRVPGSSSAHRKRAYSQEENDREIVYRTRKWSSGRRGLLELAMAVRNVPHAWEGRNLVVDPIYENVADACVARITSIAVSRRRRTDSIKVCYQVGRWSSTQLELAKLGLRCLNRRFYVENNELVVDKADEPTADVVVALLIDDLDSC
jgi:hypothetical protein